MCFLSLNDCLRSQNNKICLWLVEADVPAPTDHLISVFNFKSWAQIESMKVVSLINQIELDIMHTILLIEGYLDHHVVSWFVIFCQVSWIKKNGCVTSGLVLHLDDNLSPLDVWSSLQLQETVSLLSRYILWSPKINRTDLKIWNKDLVLRAISVSNVVSPLGGQYFTLFEFIKRHRLREIWFDLLKDFIIFSPGVYSVVNFVYHATALQELKFFFIEHDWIEAQILRERIEIIFKFRVVA